MTHLDDFAVDFAVRFHFSDKLFRCYHTCDHKKVVAVGIAQQHRVGVKEIGIAEKVGQVARGHHFGDGVPIRDGYFFTTTDGATEINGRHPDGLHPVLHHGDPNLKSIFILVCILDVEPGIFGDPQLFVAVECMQDIGVIKFRLVETLFQPKLQGFVVSDGAINKIVTGFAEILLERSLWHGSSDRMVYINIGIFRKRMEANHSFVQFVLAVDQLADFVHCFENFNVEIRRICNAG